MRYLPQHHLTALVYAYMLKDHLGNLQILLMEEKDTLAYPALTFEGQPAVPK
jgi:hypothetical protein